MKKKNIPVEFVFQLFALIIAVIIVHAFYVTIVRPRADAFSAEQSALMAADPEYVQERSVWVIIRDFEQEACFVLMLWAFAIMAYKSIVIIRNRRLLNEDLIPLAEGVRILPDDGLVIVYCDGSECELSLELADELSAMGFEQARVFFGGWPSARNSPWNSRSAAITSSSVSAALFVSTRCSSRFCSMLSACPCRNATVCPRACRARTRANTI